MTEPGDSTVCALAGLVPEALVGPSCDLEPEYCCDLDLRESCVTGWCAMPCTAGAGNRMNENEPFSKTRSHTKVWMTCERISQNICGIESTVGEIIQTFAFRKCSQYWAKFWKIPNHERDTAKR